MYNMVPRLHRDDDDDDDNNNNGSVCLTHTTCIHNIPYTLHRYTMQVFDT